MQQNHQACDAEPAQQIGKLGPIKDPNWLRRKEKCRLADRHDVRRKGGLSGRENAVGNTELRIVAGGVGDRRRHRGK